MKYSNVFLLILLTLFLITYLQNIQYNSVSKTVFMASKLHFTNDLTQ